MGAAGWLGQGSQRGGRVLGEEAPDVGAEAEQTGVPRETQAQAQGEKAAAVPYEERQMLWKGMAGRSWLELVQQWGVP